MSFPTFYEYSAPPSPPTLLLSQTEIGAHLMVPVQLMRHRQLPRAPRHSPYPKQGLQQRPACQGLLLKEPESVGTLIMEKPPGEAGRPGRGGYTLEKTLDWDPKTMNTVKEFVHALCDEKLDITRSFNNQPPVAKKELIADVSARFPNIFRRYRDGWPISDLVIAYLKYTSAQARKAMRERRGGRT
ncbi:hypothetical protein PLEOSDRAFT_1101235 [Pleurotus ostreatus PC15]|uniref:Uncharacterized protein n=2 Tax=Pleurotus TaxID=5320 RepID=A0A067P2Z2_PLEO1|nr:hypothetical protein CCMSSC00406_0007006 [Pleurotus cornucopiae]KDQ30231.1 hypothetical protein PLEOSDRAFT_1101235 [Pleurotus ostreatus PC15]